MKYFFYFFESQGETISNLPHFTQLKYDCMGLKVNIKLKFLTLNIDKTLKGIKEMNKITDTYLLKICRLSRNTKNLNELHSLKKKMKEKTLFDRVGSDVFSTMTKREKEIFEALMNHKLIKLKLNDRVFDEYYCNYGNLIEGAREVIEMIERTDLNKIAKHFDRKLYPVEYVSDYQKIFIRNDHDYIDQPIKIFENEKEIEKDKTEKQQFRIAKKEMKKLAFEEAAFIFQAEFNQQFYDELFNKLKNKNAHFCAINVA